MHATESPLRIANCSGFYGDRLAAAREMIEGGPIDVLTGDYLAELTMLILWKGRQKDPGKGYATTFLRQMQDVWGLAADRGVKTVVNAGGLNPAGLAAELTKLREKLGIKSKIVHIEGDDLYPRLDELQSAGHELRHLDTGKRLADLAAMPLSANAYLGAWGITEALEQGADVVICPRVTDAALVVGPAAWRFKWKRDDWDRLAGAVVVGHVLECGTQATGGNYAFFQEVPGLEHPGFPLAEMHSDGSAVITKHPGTGGQVSVGTVTAQLLYEIDGPDYFNPDVVARFDTIEVAQEGPDRVRISGTRGRPAPENLKVCINYLGGFRNTMTFVLTGLDLDKKAELAKRTLTAALGDSDPTGSLHFELLGSESADPQSNPAASADLRVIAKSADMDRVGRKFSSTVVEMALASYPGFYMTTPPTDATPYGVYWPALIPAGLVEHTVVLEDGTRIAIPHTVAAQSTAADSTKQPPAKAPAKEPTERSPLGRVIGARSGDKGGNANVGLWARSDAGYAWLASFLTEERFRQLLPESKGLAIRRFEFPKLRAVNFVVVGLLGEGVSSSVRPDAQAKSLGEFLRARIVEIPTSLLAECSAKSAK